MRQPHYTIAVLTDEYQEYRKQLIDQLVQVFSDAGFGTLCISGKELDPTPSHHEDYSVCNAIYDVTQHYELDGVIMLSGGLAGNAPFDRLQSMASSFEDIPLISFGLSLPGLPSVLISDHAAAKDLYEHLLSQRTASKVVFVTGKENDPYSAARETLFRQLAQRYGYTSSSILSVSGNYSSIDTYETVVALLEEYPDVGIIAAANDQMAESVVRAVHACKMSVPEDVMVVGFDDTSEATSVYPAITTVRQPLVESSVACARVMLDLIEHGTSSAIENRSQSVEFKADLIVRASTSSSVHGQRPSPGSQAELANQLVHDMKGLAPPDGVCIKQLSMALWTTLTNGCATLEQFLQQSLELTPLTEQTTHWWNNACHQIENASLQLGADADNVKTRAIITAAVANVRQHIWTIRSNVDFDRQRTNSIKANMQLQMSSCVKQSDILATLGRWLNQTMTARCFLVRFARPGPTPDSRAQLLHAYAQGVEQPIHTDYFSSKDLLPEPYGVERTRGMLIQTPVYAGNDLFGYLLLDPEGQEHVYLHSAAQSIGNALRNQHLIDQLEAQTVHLQTTNQELVKLANYDDLTGMPNRLQFNANLKKCCQLSQERGDALSLMFIDLDGFKLVNDTLGHRAGDQLLCEVASRLNTATQELLGHNGFIARLGGDEFTVSVTSAENRAAVEQIAKAILCALSQPYTIGSRTINISASIGMAEFSVDAMSLEALIKNADSAMYRAKDKGKNCASWYTAELSIVSDTLLQMDNDMRLALLNGDIQMHYQPRVNLDNGVLCAVEALMRWTMDTPDGLKMRTRPDIFIGVAEKTGFITQLDTFALDASCAQAREWEVGGTPLLVAVNVSVLHLQQDGFVENVMETVSRHQLSPYLLELEITESAMMTQVEDNVMKLRRLRSFGIQLSIDDFGTGHSSLSYLKKLPVNNLKIDKSFIADIDTLHMRRSADAAIIKSIIALGRSMDFQIIAEGVETESQRQFLRSMGCHEAQGYLFARPGPAHHIIRLLTKQQPAA